MSSAFAVDGLDVPEFVAKAFVTAGIEKPTAVQQAAIPVVLSGKDTVIQSATGTGKTLAYLLPLLQKVRADEKFRVVVIAPSPELAIQILRAVELFKGPGIGSCSLVGGGNVDRQKEKLKQHPRIVVGTPGRVLEMIFAKKLKTAEISALVLDETDEILSPDNETGLREIASRPEFKPQVILCSATFGARAEGLVKDVMDADSVRVNAGTESLPDTIGHWFMTFEAQRKEVWLAKFIKDERIKQALVFVNKIQNVPHLYRFLNDHGVTAVAISSDRSKHDREEAIAAFRAGGAKVLIATDTASRGIDVPGLPWVIHYDVARDKDAYVHRAGRTGRAGKPGKSVMMVAQNEMFLLKRYSDDLGITFVHVSERVPA